jgi:hypothetical protein
VSDKNDGRLYVAARKIDGGIVSYHPTNLHTAEHMAAAYGRDGHRALGLFDPATEQVVPKGAEVWTREQLEELVILAAERERAFLSDPVNRRYQPSNDELIAQAREGGAE